MKVEKTMELESGMTGSSVLHAEAPPYRLAACQPTARE